MENFGRVLSITQVHITPNVILLVSHKICINPDVFRMGFVHIPAIFVAFKERNQTASHRFLYNAHIKPINCMNLQQILQVYTYLIRLLLYP